MRPVIQHAAPEVLRGVAVDARADVFALGVMLYAATVGELPFDDESMFRIFQKILLEPLPRPTERVPGYPPRLEEIVLKALAKDPAERYADPAALADALEKFASESVLAVDDATLGERVRSLVGDSR